MTPIEIKRSMLRKQLNQDFGKRFCIKSEWLKKILIDVNYFDESVLDLLRIGNPKTETEINNLINSHFSLEAKAFKKPLKIYEVGKAKELF